MRYHISTNFQLGIIVSFGAIFFFGLPYTINRTKADTPTSTSFLQFERVALASVQPKVDHIVQSSTNQSNITPFIAHNNLIDEITTAAMAGIEDNRKQSLDDLLRPQSRKTNSKNPSVPKPSIVASDLLLKYNTDFCKYHPILELSENDRDLLNDFVSLKLTAALDFLSARAFSVAVAQPESKDRVYGLALVPLWLNIPDTDWTLATAAKLPIKLQSDDALRSCELAALAAKRPLTAFYLSERAGHRSPNEINSLQIIEYMQKHTDILVRDGKYNEALACSAVGEHIAIENNVTNAKEIQFQYAQLLSDLHKPQVAAEVVKDLTQSNTDSQSLEQSRLLRLKYLYEANAFVTVLAEYRGYYKSATNKEYQPQILYIAWCAARNLQPDLERQLRKEFLETFPSDPLGEDLYFSVAMQAIAVNNYSEAKRVLDFLQFQYPSSSAISKVKVLQTELANGIGGGQQNNVDGK